ncbi:MAG: pyridoxal-phosphate dependent enzyme [Polyangiaceae bacterium]|nr:pyridoxal-phosphate dependent enzyme [Polyangiaceae bacterium]
MTEYAATLDSIRAARETTAPWVHRTPIFTCAALDRLASRKLFFKCENLQHVGAFKFRGALNAVMRLPDDAARRGVVTHSSGNHAQALALAAKLRGIPAHVVMPTTSPRVKRDAVVGYGGRVIPCEPTLAARERVAREVAEDTGAVMIPPYDHPDVIAGQGTVALEVLEQVPEVDAIVAPIGGGGLISGIALAAKAQAPGISVFGAEPSGADDAARSKAARELLPQHDPKTIADGLLAGLGRHTWPVVRDHVDRIITVSDDEIVAAMRLVFERMKLVVEPSGAVSVAAVLSDAFRSMPGLGRVAVVLSGGNVDLAELPFG